ncbi:Met28 bZIP domain-containing protein [Candida orthopsilosis Co 90-125]|uniref:Met28 bZIP domain-containing protein n=1 Tax=Candida orthopsilosis (strain 90-125) TaxID=1136231 RepID=H8XAS5_CANO9|nr:Met28 bZIP domain-containing protein [Candida orthopsilosis Co 90-125]CCG24926.1 Met28 bZIP domain-containing protein [Candida orthopsilosis Co 90-125]
MSFHPNYYLNGLNLEYEEDTNTSLHNNNMFSPSPSGNHDLITEEDIQQHLDLFSGAANEFYSLDVVGDNTVVPIKPVQQHQQQQYKNESSANKHQSAVNSSAPLAHNFALTANTTAIPSPNSVASTPYTPSVYTYASQQANFQTQPSNAALSSQSSLEDKKKRNTAASARFRIKKKLKEQEMERKAKELEEKVAILEKKLKTMEMENKCLKSIIFQQNEQKNIDLLESIKKKSIIDSKSNFEYTV